MALTDTFIRSIKATGKIQKISDGNRLYLHVSKNGNKLWRVRYSFNGKRNSISLGAYPYISLADARKLLIEVNEQLAKGRDPSAYKKAVKAAQDAKNTNSFEIKAREWHAVNKNKWTEGHAKRIMLNLEKDVFPFIGNMPIVVLVKYAVTKDANGMFVVEVDSTMWEGLALEKAVDNMKSAGMPDEVMAYVLSNKMTNKINQETIGNLITGKTKTSEAHKKWVNRLLKEFNKHYNPF